jgi:hypothetical protein
MYVFIFDLKYFNSSVDQITEKQIFNFIKYCTSVLHPILAANILRACYLHSQLHTHM